MSDMKAAEQIARNVRLIALERIMGIVQALMVPLTIAALVWGASSIIELRESVAQAAKQADVAAIERTVAQQSVKTTSLEKAIDESAEAVDDARESRDQQHIDTVQRLARLEEQVKSANDMLARLLTELSRRSETTPGGRRAFR